MMGTLYNDWGQYEKAESYLIDALEIIQSAYLTQHAGAAYGKLTVICNDCLSTLLYAVYFHAVMSNMGRCYRLQEKLPESHRRSEQICLVIGTVGPQDYTRYEDDDYVDGSLKFMKGFFKRSISLLLKIFC